MSTLVEPTPITSRAVAGKKTNSSTQPGRKSAEVDPSAGVSPTVTTVKCVVCDQKRVDGKDQAEGVCRGWCHRYCVGVSLVYFQYLSTSTPFYCVACFCKEEVTDLKNAVSILRGEISKLREALEEK